ncbi:MAG: GAF domain-containing protein, partial [Anaerolineae bacterium]
MTTERELQLRLAQKRAQLAALREISRAINAAWDLDTTLDLITRTTARVMGMDSCSIYLLDPAGTHLVLAATTGLDPAAVGRAKLALGEGVTGWAALHGEPVALGAAAEDPRFKYLPDTGETRFQSLAAMPLVSGDHIVGAINIQTTAEYSFSRDETELLGLVADLAAGALERARLYDDLRRQVRELSALAETSQTLTGPMYLDEMLQVIVETTARTMNAADCSLALIEDGRLRLWVTQHPREGIPEEVAIGEGLMGHVAATGETLIIPDVTRDPWAAKSDWAVSHGLVSMLAVPLQVRERTIGVLACYTDAPREFSPDDITLFSTLANQTALAIDNAQLAVQAVVVQEMHHRVKNNLQNIAMLLRLQLGDTKVAGARQALTESINRILSIAAVHELLSREGLRRVDVDEMARRVALGVAQNMAAGERGIEVVVTGTQVSIPSQPATALALIINELIQNALEHAFQGRPRGQVEVNIDSADDYILLQVMDDGIGLPPAFDPLVDGNLGLELVRTLASDDLNGEFDMTSDKGTRAVV